MDGKETRYCENCRFSQGSAGYPGNAEYMRCASPKNVRPQHKGLALVKRDSGPAAIKTYCMDLRLRDSELGTELCGPTARWFEPKVKPAGEG